MLKDLILLIEILSFLASLLIYRRKNVPKYLSFFTIFLFITSVVEGIGSMTRSTSMVAMPMYNYFTILEFVFYFYVLYQIIWNDKVKKLIVITAITYTIIALLHILSAQDHVFQGFPFMLAAFTTVAFCIYHLYELFSTPNVSTILSNPTFWLCAGLLSFYGCVTSMLGAWNLFLNMKLDSKVDDIILGFFNYILYSSFTIGFLTFLKNTREKNV